MRILFVILIMLLSCRQMLIAQTKPAFYSGTCRNVFAEAGCNKKDKMPKLIKRLWNTRLEPYSDGYFDPYYGGLLYLFSLVHLSGKYHIIKPGSN